MKSINNFLNESLILEANTSGQFYESLVCYLFNLDMDDFLKDRDNNTWDEHIIKWHQWMKLKIDNPWVESCITTAKAIRNFLPQEAGGQQDGQG